jgi:DNA replication regulator SLD3
MGTTPMVLVARLDDGKTYAVERESQGLYVVCKLGSWVDMSSIYESAVVSKPLPRTAREEMKHLNLPIPADENSQITAESIKYQKKKRLAIEAIQSMVKRPSGGVLGTQNQKEMQNSQTDSQMDYKVDSQIESQVELNMQEAETQKAEDDAVTQPGSGELLENIRTQYFETLYLSKVRYLVAHI